MNKLIITAAVTLALITGVSSVNAAEYTTTCKKRVAIMKEAFCTYKYTGDCTDNNDETLCKYTKKKAGKITKDCKKGDNLKNIMSLRVPSKVIRIGKCFTAKTGSNNNSCCGNQYEKY